jgi:4'-phosphopantetheinyl transferase EntD
LAAAGVAILTSGEFAGMPPLLQCLEPDFAGLMSTLLPERVAVAAMSTVARASHNFELFPEEAAAIRGAVERRRAEFASGRWCARTALRELGGPAVGIGVAQDRAPIWPDGFVGSISHAGDLCCAAVARRSDVRSLGIDVEDAGALEQGLEAVICTDAERVASARLPALRASTWSKMAFVAKEAYYKCYAPVMKSFLEFHDVSVDFVVTEFSNGLPVGGEFTVRLTPSRRNPDVAFEPRGRWMLAGNLALAAVAALPT